MRKRRAADTSANSENPANAPWAGQHPWRPFDRDKDLLGPSKKITSEDMLKKAGSLAGRFATG